MVHRTSLARPDSGFSLVELLVATVIVLIVFGAMAALVNPAGYVSEVEPDAIDMQQRARVGAETISRDLYIAGAGLDSGPRVGALGGYLPPILPRRIGAPSDAPSVARPDVVSVIWVPQSSAQTDLLTPLSGTTMTVREGEGCPPAEPSCGFAAGTGVLIFDALGNFDLFTALAVAGPDATLRHRGPASSHAYGRGAFVAEVEARTYYFDAASKQLRVSDADLSDAPVIDDVVDFRVEYFGSPGPPVLPKPEPGESNCLYDSGGTLRSGLTTLPVGFDGQAALPLDMLGDGPWCGSDAAQFDVDLLRIRRVRITIRVQTPSAFLRGTGSGFLTPGTSRSVWRRLPDAVVTFDASPRNLNLSE